ncbi:MAG: TerB family tellurite resistance protein [Bacillota bacterium]
MGLGTIIFTTIIGFVFLGPFGAILGIFFGLYLNRSRISSRSYTRFNRQSAEGRSQVNSSQLYFYKQLYGMLAKLAQADGAVTREEINIVDEFTDYELNLPHTLKKEVINLFDQAKKDDTTFETYARNFHKIVGNQPGILIRLMELMQRIARANGGNSSQQTELLHRAIDIFGLSKSNYRNRNQKDYYQRKENNNNSSSNVSSRSRKDPYEVLDCSPEDSTEVIKKKYRELVKEYHPDRIISKDLPEDFIEFANKRFKEIQNAYEKIMKQRGNMS